MIHAIAQCVLLVGFFLLLVWVTLAIIKWWG